MDFFVVMMSLGILASLATSEKMSEFRLCQNFPDS
jgi:hypothetical protein